VIPARSPLWGAFAALVLVWPASAPAAPAPTGAAGAASSRLEVVPDAGGAARLRVAHGLRLGLDLPGRWRVDLFAAARFGGGFGLSRAVELASASLRYDGPAFGLAVGRFAEPGVHGRLLLDGVSVRVGEAGAFLGARAWVGHSWHPEPAWTAAPEVSGGAEITLRPPRPDGDPGPTVLALGGSLRGAGAVPELRLWAHGDGRIRGGGRWALGVESAPSSPERLRSPAPLRAIVRLDGPTLRAVAGGVEARWEGLPRLGVPLGLPTPQELLAPHGYGVVRGRLGVRMGRWEGSVDGGPTVRPHPGGPLRAGWIARVRSSVGLGPSVRIGGLVTGAGLGPSWVAGGGGAASVQLGALDGTLEGVLLRVRGLDGLVGSVAELRARAVVTLPAPAPGAPLVRISGEIAGGEDRLLAAFVRGGLGVELSGAGGTRGGAR
jgi:hypothetical protein